jgi:hypothetical protein
MASKPWVKIGVCHVDAGMLAIGDPCYVAHDSHPDHPFHNWGKFCDQLGNENYLQLNHKLGHAGLGVVAVVGSDGEFTVEARTNRYGNISEIRIKRASNEE